MTRTYPEVYDIVKYLCICVNLRNAFIVILAVPRLAVPELAVPALSLAAMLFAAINIQTLDRRMDRKIGEGG